MTKSSKKPTQKGGAVRAEPTQEALLAYLNKVKAMITEHGWIIH
jgi:hypothetical protein